MVPPRARERAPWTLLPAMLDPLLVATMSILALVILLPDLMSAPAFTDEMAEALLSLAVARGEQWPLTGVSGYLGPLHTYLTAGALALLGPHLILPRLLVATLASLTVGLTYLLGQQVGGRSIGLLAGGLLATTPVQLIVTGHIAWQHSTAPFWTTAALVALRRAWPGGGRWLIAGSFLMGVAIQTHPVVATLVPGMALAWLWPGRPRHFTRRDIMLAVLAGLAPLLPLLCANTTGGWPALRDAEQRPYAYALGAGPAVYGEALARSLAALPRAAAGSLSEGLPLLESLGSWPVLLAAALLVAGLAWAVRRDERLLIGVVLSMIVLLPLVNRDYLLPLQGRFLAPLMPVLAVLVAGVLIAATETGWRLIASAAGSRRLAGGLLVVIAALIALVGIIGPFAASRAFLGQVRTVGMGNEVILSLTEVLTPARQEAVVAIDVRLAELPMPGRSTMLQGLRAALELEALTTEFVTLPGDLPPVTSGKVRYLLVYPGTPPPANDPWTLILSFPNRTRRGLYSADLYRQ